MKALPRIWRALAVIAAGLACRGQAQISRAFPDGTLLPGSQSRPAQLAAAVDSAVILPPFSGAALVHERNGSGVWALTQTIAGSFSAVGMNSTGTQFAVGRQGQIDLYNRSGPGAWSMFGSAYLPANFLVRKVAFEGERVAALVDTQGSVTPGGMLVRIFEYNAADWEMVEEIRILSTAELVEVGREIVVSDFSMQGTRIAIGSRSENLIRIHERDQGGIGNWGVLKEITGASNSVTELGDHLALSGTRLAASSRAGANRRMDVFSQNMGGANQFGYWGPAVTAPAAEIEDLIPHADAANGYLGVLGLPDLVSETLSYAAPAKAWIFRPVLGGGPGNWLQVANMTLAVPNGIPLLPPGMGFGVEDFFLGLTPASTPGLAPAWTVPVHRRSTGGTDGWQQQQLLAGPGTAARLGRSMATSGKYVAVGMPDDAVAGAQSGSVMVWFQAKMEGGSVWVPAGRFEATTPAAGARFGESVTVFDDGSDDWMAVGAPGENSGRGAVYLFNLSPFFPAPATKRLIPASTLDAADGFGSSVSFWSDFHLAVGCPGDEDAGSNAGAAYVFEMNLGGTANWGQRKKLPRPAGETLTGFGTSLAFNSDVLCVALPPSASVTGKIFAFEKNQGGTNNWGQFSFKTAPAGSTPGFPTALSATPDFGILAVGAPGNLPAVPGKAYIFGIDTSDLWSEVASLGGTAAEGHGFGTKLASYGGQLVVGNPLFGSGGKTFTYAIVSSGGPLAWNLLHTREGAPGDALGSAVGVMPLFTFSGAPWSDLAGTDAGAVLVDRSGAYELWAANRGPGFTQWFPEQDQDGDGLANLAEFGLGGNPLSAASRPPFTMVQTIFIGGGSTTFPALRWDVPVLPYPTSGLNYQMRRSSNLIQWNNASIDGGLGLGDPPGRYFRMPPPRGFFRIQFRYPEESSAALLLSP